MRKEDQIRVLVTQKEKDELTTTANRAGLPVASWLRSVGLQEARQPPEIGPPVQMDPRPPILVYQALMQSVKNRIAGLRRLATGSLSLGDERLNWEWAALQLRMVLEGVAFASLAAQRDAYAKVHARFAEHWNASWLLRDLRKVNPEFYPQPKRMTDGSREGVKRLEEVKDYLTEAEFAELYELCSQIIHSHNPFGDLKPIDTRLTLIEWIGRIEALLDTHVIRPHGSNQRWIVQMSAVPDGTVQVAVAEPKA